MLIQRRVLFFFGWTLCFATSGFSQELELDESDLLDKWGRANQQADRHRIEKLLIEPKYGTTNINDQIDGDNRYLACLAAWEWTRYRIKDADTKRGKKEARAYFEAWIRGKLGVRIPSQWTSFLFDSESPESAFDSEKKMKYREYVISSDCALDQGKFQRVNNAGRTIWENKIPSSYPLKVDNWSGPMPLTLWAQAVEQKRGGSVFFFACNEPGYALIVEFNKESGKLVGWAALQIGEK